MNEYKPVPYVAVDLVYIYDGTDYHLIDGYSVVPMLLSVVYNLQADITSRESLVQRLNALGDYYAGETDVIPEFSGLYWSTNGTNYQVASAETKETLAAQYNDSSEEEFKKVYSDALYFAAMMCDDSESYNPFDTDNQASYNELKAAMVSAEESEFNSAVAPLAKGVSVNNVQVIGETEEEDSGAGPLDPGGSNVG